MCVAQLLVFAVMLSQCNAFLPSLGLRITHKLAQIRPKIAPMNTALFLSTADFKTGMTFELGALLVYRTICSLQYTNFSLLYCFADGVPVRLQEFLHVKPGKGAAFVRTKVKNLVNGSVQEKTFRAGESIVNADVEKTDMQYTYTNGDMVYFMNMNTYEEQSIDKNAISNVDMLIEGMSEIMRCIFCYNQIGLKAVVRCCFLFT